MTQPLFFEPDPTIPDSDLLGYGNLLFDNGTSQWINGDPDVASLYAQPSARMGTTTIENPQTDYEGGSSDPLTSPASYVPDQVPQVIPRMDRPPPAQIPGTDISFDAETGEPIETEQGAMMGGPMEGPPQMPPQGGEPQILPKMDRPPPAQIPGTNVVFDPETGAPMSGGSSPEIGGAGGEYGYGTGGLQLAQREGALPPEIAAAQASQRGTLNTNEMLALSTQRDAEANIYRTAALQRQGQLDAEKAAQEKTLQEQQARMDRLQQEQRQTAEMDIKTDLVSANGVIGAAFSILGAAMLGYVGSDAGLRMMDSSIDTNVRKQVSQRDSKLKMLADQLGSTEQAVAAGKAAIYKLLAEKAEVTQQLTKADVFEAQTPEILTSLRQKQQLAEQEFQNKSLGKTLEKAPVLTGPKPADVQKYGKAASDQQQNESNIKRAANALGLEGWDPKTKTFRNRGKVLEKGIAGVGTQDTFARDVGKLPFVGALPQAFDNLVTSKEGVAIRAALESLVAAEAAAQNPGRAPTDADRDAARLSLGLNTEEGTVAAIERLYAQQDLAKAQNVATYGQGAASAYERSIDAQGARPPQPTGNVDRGRPLEQGKARQQLQDELGRQGPQSNLDPIREVAGELQTVAGRELPPEGLKILEAQAAHETGDGKHLPNNNAFGHKASGGATGAALMTTEGEGKEARRVRQNFATYGSLLESVTDHVDLLKRKYPDAWRALELGDAPAYVAALKDGGYFTGNETEYLNGLMRRL